MQRNVNLFTQKLTVQTVVVIGKVFNGGNSSIYRKSVNVLIALANWEVLRKKLVQLFNLLTESPLPY